MAYIAHTIKDLSSDDKTSWTIDWDTVDHQVDDMLMLVLMLDDDAGTPTGWTGYTSITDRTSQSPQSTFLRLDAYYKIATTTSEGSTTITTSSLNGQLVGYVIRDADTTTTIDAVAASVDNTNSSATKTIPAITTTTNNCLIFVFGAANASSSSRFQREDDDIKQGKLLDLSRIASESYYTAVEGQNTAGLLASENIYTVAQRSLFVHIAIRNKSGGSKPIVATGGLDYKLRAGAFDAPTFVSLSTQRTTINALTVDAVSLTNTHANPNLTYDDTGTSTGIAITQSGTTNRINGAVCDIGTLFGANQDMSGPMTFSCRVSAVGNNADHFIYLEDGSGNWVAKVIDDTGILANQDYYYFKSFSDFTTYDSSGVLDYTDVKYYGFGFELKSTLTGTRNIYISGVASLTNKKVFTGGNAEYPVNGRQISGYMLYNDAHGVAFSAGKAQDIITYGYQLGDGTNPVHYIGAGSSVEFPFLLENYEFNDLDLDIALYGSSSCVFDYRSSITASTKLNTFTIDPSSSTSASYLFTSAIIDGFDVTWKTGITCDGAAFSNCAPIDAKGGVFNNCAIRETVAGASEAAISFDTNSSMDGTEIDVTDTSAGYHIELGTAVTAFTLTDVTFTGTPGTDKVHVLATTGGTVTITIAGTTSLVAGDVTSAGASISIVAPEPDVTVTVTTIDGTPIQNARVYLKTDPGGVEVLSALTNASGVATTTYSGSTPQAVEGWVRSSSGSPYYREFPLGGSITSSGYDATALMSLDE